MFRLQAWLEQFCGLFGSSPTSNMSQSHPAAMLRQRNAILCH